MTAPVGEDEEGRVLVRWDGVLNRSCLDRQIEKLAPVLEQEEPLPVCIDLRGLEFCSPCGLSVLTAAVGHAIGEGLIASDSLFLSPTDPSVRHYIRRMDLFKGLVEWTNPEPFARHEPQGFTPLVSFEVGEAAVVAARDLTKSVGGDEETQRALKWALSELTENVVFHANAPWGGVACAQSWRPGVVELAIADRGRGIPASLRENPRHATLTDEEALMAAVVRHISGLEDTARGLGLWLVSQMVEVNGGQLEVRCGARRLSQSGPLCTVGQTRAVWPGTLVVVTLDKRRPMDIRATLDRLAPPENDFEWLQIGP